MLNEIIKEETNCASVELLDKTQASVENKILTDQEIVKILTVKSFVNVLHYEAQNGEIHFSGKLKTEVAYETLNLAFASQSNEIEWTQVVKNDKIKANDFACITANVIDSLIASVNNNEIIINNVVEFEIKLTQNDKIEFVSDGGENIYVLNEEYKTMCLNKTDKQQFELSFEIDAKSKINKILNSSCCLKQKNIRCLNSYVSIDGQMFCDLILNVEENEIKIINDESAFNQEFMLEGVSDSSKVDVELSVIGVNFETSENKIIVKTQICACFNVYNEKTLNLVSDVYSTTNETALNVSSILINKFNFAFNDNEEVNGNVFVGESGYEIRKIDGVIPKNLVFATTYFQDGELTIEGVATFCAIYTGVEDDTNSTDVDLPFVLKIKNNDLAANQIFAVKGCLCGIKARIRKANEIEISATINFFIKTYSAEEFAFVSNVEIGEEKEESDSAITVYVISENETLFDIAKKLSVSLNELLAQNPNLATEVIAGEQIVVYRQKIMN